MAERQETDIIDQATDWGTTVSEAKARKTPITRILMLVACVLLAAGSVLLIPVMAGTMLFNSSGAGLEIIVVGALLFLALAFKRKSGNQPRNALQIDYQACELRLGAEHANGTFMREQVIGFREIEEVSVDDSDARDPALCLRVPGELITLRFHGADTGSLNDLASKIAAARESALRAPIRSRIQSRMMGFEASFREAKQRIRTRIVTRTAT